jgi:hypothetical protein
MFEKYVNPIIFIISFVICLVIVYFTNPEPIVMYRFPNPDNAGKLTYQDKQKNCFKYEATEVKCPSEPDLIIDHPLIIH